MSKIGKINISVPEKVKVAINGNILNIDGPLGKKSLKIDTEIFDLDINSEKKISIRPKKINDETKRLWGMNRSLMNNAGIGWSTGYVISLELVGVGYRGALKGNQLNLQLGYSHDIKVGIPEDISVKCPKQTEIHIFGANKQRVGQFASEIRALRKPEPYKGKGIKYSDEFIRKKAGKSIGVAEA